MRSALKTSVVLFGMLQLAACGSSGSSDAGTGGAQGAGGNLAGGTSAKSSTGTFANASGGSSGAGGTSGSAVATGGAVSTGGGAATGGRSTTSTVVPSGGQTQAGGAPTGGVSTKSSAGGAGTGGKGIGGTSPVTTGGTSKGGSAAGGAGVGGSSALTTGGSTSTSASACGTEPYTKPSSPPTDEDGSELWLRYRRAAVPACLSEYQAQFAEVVEAGASATLQAAQAELVKGLGGITGRTIPVSGQPSADGAVVLGTPESSEIVSSLGLSGLAAVGDDGYVIVATETGGKKVTVVAGNTDAGVLYGSFALLRHLQRNRSVQGLSLSGAPKVQRRLLNHWDDLDGKVERGYAGKSLWNWSSLPGTISQRYKDYARANASLGINGVVLNNVNAESQILTSSYLDKVAALAATFRPYGIKVYLSAQFGAPSQIGGQANADPSSSGVRQWWVTLGNTIYQKIPDFGGFLVKANSEGQPGPADYGLTHADGANMMAAAIVPHGGIVMWRAFVYKDDGTDRIGQAYKEFKPLDGRFSEGVMVQVKNGPLDFQPREPFHPLFGAMPSTPLALELQITKEYLGEDTHLAYLGTMYEEVLKSDTYAKGQGSTVARVIDGTTHGYAITAMAGVANIGSDTNWTGSHFNQANWYVYGRMAWDPDASARDIAEEWINQTFTNDPAFVTPVTELMMKSRQAVVDYMTPLGLVHIMGTDHHYGPAPWVNNLSQANWNPFYYHKADGTGVGFDRTSAGSNAVSQYAATVRDQFASKASVPLDFLLFFQRMGWDDSLSSTGRSVWNELVHRYSLGVDAVGTMRDAWNGVQGFIDAKRFKEVSDFLQIQHYEARWWRDACLQYFASLSKKSIPNGYAAPAHDLSWYQNLNCPSDVTKPRCPDVYTGNPSPAITQ